MGEKYYRADVPKKTDQQLNVEQTNGRYWSEKIASALSSRNRRRVTDSASKCYLGYGLCFLGILISTLPRLPQSNSEKKPCQPVRNRNRNPIKLLQSHRVEPA